MSELPAHFGFVAAAYAIVVATVGLLVGKLVIDHRRLVRRLADLEARGVRRRAGAGR